MCTSTRRCCSCDAGLLHRCRLHHQCLCGGVIPVIGLQGYVTDLP
jgi:hypothetical protein